MASDGTSEPSLRTRSYLAFDLPLPQAYIAFEVFHRPDVLLTLKNGGRMQDLLKDYPVVIEIPLAWGDMDAFQHVNTQIERFIFFGNVRMDR
jgi:hypothetical protein